MHFRRAAILSVMIWIALSAARATAQPLADRVPADAVIYIGWAGADSPIAGYKGSRLEAVANASNFSAALNDLSNQLLAKISKDDKESAEAIRTAMDMAGPIWRHPTAIFVAPGTDDAKPIPRFGVICQAGAETKDLLAKVNGLLEKGKPPAEVKVKAAASGDTFIFSVGYDDLPASAKGGGLKAAPHFAGAMKQVQADAVVVFYLDAENIVAAVDRAVGATTEQQLKAIWPKVRDTSGFGGFKRFVMTGKFDGRDWAEQMFADAPAPRKGFLALYEGKPLDEATMRLIPASAGYASVKQWDFAAMMHAIRDIAEAVDPNGGQYFDQGMGAIQMSLGRNVMTDVLEPLGPIWVSFSDAAVAGNSPTGIVLLNKLDDPAKGKQGITATWIGMCNMAAGFLRQQAPQIQPKQMKSGEMTIFYVQTPQLAPGWTIAGDKLIIGLDPNAIAKAAAAKAPNQSFAAGNTKYTALTKRLGAPSAAVTQFEFVDLPETATAMHQQYEQALAQLRGVAQQQGINIPQNILPAIDVVKANLAPSLSQSWADASGFHSKYSSPFPGCEAYSNSPNFSSSAVGVSALGVSILLPSLNRARETANRVKCASNMRQIGQGILLYSNDHRGQYPPDLAALAREEDMAAEMFICPSGNKSAPAGAGGFTKDQLADWVVKNTDYTYLGAGKTNATPADEIVLYENPADHGSDGVNALFGDGHVEFLNMSQAQQAIPNLKAPGR
jgi:prepilin-type processing-associated H-X9-DG protein